MRDIKSLADAQIAIRELQDQLRTYTNPTIIDLKKRRIVNASPSIVSDDYVIREELANLKSEITAELNKIKASLNFLENRVKALEP